MRITVRVRRAGHQVCMLDSEERVVGKRKVELVEISADLIRIHPTI